MPSAFAAHDGAPEGRVTAAVKLLELRLEWLAGRVSAQETSRKRAEDSSKRLDALEGQACELTKEAKEYAHNKCLELDRGLCTQLGSISSTRRSRR